MRFKAVKAPQAPVDGLDMVKARNGETVHVPATTLRSRGSDGQILKAIRRRRVTTVSAMASVSVAGTAIAAVLLSGNVQTNAVNASSEVQAEQGPQALGAEAVDANIDASGDAVNNGEAQSYAGVPSAKDRKAQASSRSITRTVLPGCDGKAPTEQASNGQLPDSWLCKIGVGNHQLRSDAAIAFAEMNAAYKADTGKSLAVTDSYRPLESQISVAARKPGFAARPGSSQHGWGLAIDFGAGTASASGQQYNWLVKNAGKYGWENPDWAKSSKYEPWHWEYVPARDQIKGK